MMAGKHDGLCANVLLTTVTKSAVQSTDARNAVLHHQLEHERTSRRNLFHFVRKNKTAQEEDTMTQTALTAAWHGRWYVQSLPYSCVPAGMTIAQTSEPPLKP